MTTDRRRFLTLLGAGAAGAAVAGVPSLEAQTTRAFSELGETGAAAALSEARRAYFGAVTPFMATPAPVDVTSLSKAHELDAKSMTLDDERPNVYYALWNANGPGANGSYWLSEILGRVRSSAEADITVTLHPRNFPADPADPTAQRFLPGSSSFHWQNPLDMFFGGSGTAWLEIRSSEPLDFSDGYTFNQAQDGTRQGQAGPIIDAASVRSDARFARAGDTVNFELYGREEDLPEGTHRENWLLFAPPESATIRVDYQLVDKDGVAKSNVQQLWVEPGTWKQIDGVHTIFPGMVAKPGDALRATVKSTDPNADAFLYSIMSKVDNQDPEKQDPYSDEGYIKRGLEDATIYRSGNVEDSDPQLSRAYVRAGLGTVIDEVHIDWDGSGTFADHHTGLNQQEWLYENMGIANATTGPVSPRMRVVFSTPQLGQISRDFEGAPYSVIAEPDDYTPEDSYAKTRANLEALATLIGGNINTVFINTNMHFGVDEVRNILDVYTNGTTGDQDPELDRVIIKEGTNSVDFRRTDGGTAVWAGFTERQMDELRTLYQ